MSIWSPEKGFEDDVAKTPYYHPLIAREENRVWFDLGKHEEIRKQCEEAKTYFPKGILDRTDKRNFVFPMMFFTPKNDEQENFKKMFYTEEIEKKGHMFLFEARVVPFYIHTPTLFTLMMPGKVHEHMICTEVIFQYFCVLQNLLHRSEENEGFNPSVILESVMNDTVEEMRNSERILTANLCGSGMMQHYFSDKRDPVASTELVKLFIQYTFRVIQSLERQILKLSALKYKQEKSEILCCSAILPMPLNEDEINRITNTSKMFIQNNFMVPTIEKLLSVEAPNKNIETPTFILNVCVEYCENVLWLTQQMPRLNLKDTEEE